MRCGSWPFEALPSTVAPIEEIGGCRSCQVYAEGFAPIVVPIKVNLCYLVLLTFIFPLWSLAFPL